MAKAKSTNGESERKARVHVFAAAPSPTKRRKLLFRRPEDLEAWASEPMSTRPKPAPPTERRGATGSSEADLRAAVLAYAGFGNGSGDPDARRERQRELEAPEQRKAVVMLDELRIESERLRTLVDRATALVERASDQGGAVGFLKGWVDGFRMPPIPDLSAHGELARLVRYWDGLVDALEKPRLSDRELALVALRTGYWPRTTVPVESLNVAKIVKHVTKNVRELRRGQ